MWQRIRYWIYTGAWALCVPVVGGLAGFLSVAPISMNDTVHGIGGSIGALVGVVVAVRSRNSPRTHSACLLTGPFVMAAAFALFVYAVLDAWEKPYGGLGVLIGAILCGAISLCGLLISLAGWFGSHAAALRNQDESLTSTREQVLTRR